MEIMHDKLTLFNSVELYKGPIITVSNVFDHSFRGEFNFFRKVV